MFSPISLCAEGWGTQESTRCSIWGQAEGAGTLLIAKGVWSSFEAMHNCSSRLPFSYSPLWDIIAQNQRTASGGCVKSLHILPVARSHPPCLSAGSCFCLQLRSLLTEKRVLPTSLPPPPVVLPDLHLIAAISSCVHRMGRGVVNWN